MKTRPSWLNRIKWEKANLKKIIYKEKADVVLSLQNIAVFGLKLPQVVYVHQSIPFQKVKKFSFFKKEERLFAIYQYIIGRRIWYSIKIADAVIVQTQWMKEAIISKMYDCKNKVYVIPPAIDWSIFQKLKDFRDKPMNMDRITTFFYPAGALLYKNFEVIIKASYKLLEKGVDSFRIVLTIKGDENSYAALIKKMAEGLGERVVFAGKMTREEVCRMYLSSTLVFPSYIETFGLPLLEARLSGSIILVADCLFSKEILQAYSSAYYFEPFNADMLADLMSKVIYRNIVAKAKIVSSEVQSESTWKSVLSIIECSS